MPIPEKVPPPSTCRHQQSDKKSIAPLPYLVFNLGGGEEGKEGQQGRQEVKKKIEATNKKESGLSTTGPSPPSASPNPSALRNALTSRQSSTPKPTTPSSARLPRVGERPVVAQVNNANSATASATAGSPNSQTTTTASYKDSLPPSVASLFMKGPNGGDIQEELKALTEIIQLKSRQMMKAQIQDNIRKEKEKAFTLASKPIPKVYQSGQGSDKVTSPPGACAAEAGGGDCPRNCSRYDGHLSQLKCELEKLSTFTKQQESLLTTLQKSMVSIQLARLRKDDLGTDKETTDLMLKLHSEIQTLTRKLDVVETKLVNQENFNRSQFFSFTSEEDSGSDSTEDFGDSAHRPSNWAGTTGAPMTRKGGTKTPTTQRCTGIEVLKECVTWVPVAPDFDRLLYTITVFNLKMDRNQSMKMTKKGNEASFKNADTIQLTIFKNGLILGDTGFRSYATLSVIQFINELFNGRFPSELNAQFPDGVILVVTDKRSMCHSIAPHFFGGGYKLLDPRPFNDPENKVGDVEAECIPHITPKESIELLTNLLKRRVSGLQPWVKLAPSPVTSASSVPTILPDIKEGPRKKGDKERRFTLKLKNISDGLVYKLNVLPSTTVKRVIAHVEKCTSHFPSPKADNESSLKPPQQFDLILPLPLGVLSSVDSTLKEYGIRTNTLLHLRPKPPPPSEESSIIYEPVSDN